MRAPRSAEFALLLACCLVPALFLPRSKPARTVDPTSMMGH